MSSMNQIIDSQTGIEIGKYYACEICLKKFKGVINPQDTGDSILCDDCWSVNQ